MASWHGGVHGDVGDSAYASRNLLNEDFLIGVDIPSLDCGQGRVGWEGSTSTANEATYGVRCRNPIMHAVWMAVAARHVQKYLV